MTDELGNERAALVTPVAPDARDFSMSDAVAIMTGTMTVEEIEHQ